MVTTKLYGGTSGVARACSILTTCTAAPTLRGSADWSVGLLDVILVPGLTSNFTTTLHGGTYAVACSFLPNFTEASEV
jgi:hypothetical protein